MIETFVNNLNSLGSSSRTETTTLDVIVKAFEAEKAQLKAEVSIYKARAEEAEKRLADIRKLIDPPNLISSQYVWQLQELSNQKAAALAQNMAGLASKGLK